ncbi:MAG: VOC family protein, partial [Burkholderiales bacterium]
MMNDERASSTLGSAASSQVPAAGSLNIDHVSHFVPDMDEASAALERLGFTLTPFSAQSHRLER